MVTKPVLAIISVIPLTAMKHGVLVVGRAETWG